MLILLSTPSGLESKGIREACEDLLKKVLARLRDCVHVGCMSKTSSWKASIPVGSKVSVRPADSIRRPRIVGTIVEAKDGCFRIEADGGYSWAIHADEIELLLGQ